MGFNPDIKIKKVTNLKFSLTMRLAKISWENNQFKYFCDLASLYWEQSYLHHDISHLLQAKTPLSLNLSPKCNHWNMHQRLCNHIKISFYFLEAFKVCSANMFCDLCSVIFHFCGVTFKLPTVWAYCTMWYIRIRLSPRGRTKFLF